MPNKPHKWSYNLFVMSGISWFACDFEIFEIFCGSENEDRQEGEQDLGSSSNVVIRLSHNVPRNVNHKLLFDNYYTSLPLLVYLMKLGIYSLGTVRKNHIPNCKLAKEDQFKK
jgi:hypothetical protein